MHKLLVIEDDAGVADYLRQGLTESGYAVDVARTGPDGYAMAAMGTYEVILLDVMLPGMDGFDVARLMREHPTSQTIPIIFVTAMASTDARLKGLDLGAVDFITKPIDPATLKPRVRNFMRYVQLRKDLQAGLDSMVETAALREDVERITRHDLKAPLAGALGLVQALMADDSMGRRQVEQLRLMEDSVMQVLGMINLSSELYRIESGRFVLRAQPVPIGELLRRIAEMHRITFAEKRLAIAVDTDVAVGATPPLALADATLCYSIFQNLLTNACEAAPAGSRVSIQLHEQDPLRIVISNHGAVPVAIRERFFDKFVTAGKAQGTGLGTYSARLLTEAQHGSIALEVLDESDTTRITVMLPRAADS